MAVVKYEIFSEDGERFEVFVGESEVARLDNGTFAIIGGSRL